ncbi:MAG TPA: single-stranded DNA-binding protein [Rugosimonospora sp.]|nr:single-stranded DNA-binding protein [Rugosimonospora sp.]
MPLFTCFIEGRLTASAQTGHTSDARAFVQFPIVTRDRYRGPSGQWVDEKAMFFEVVCWGALAGRVRDLTRGDQVIVEAGQLLPYITENDMPALKVHARNVSVSARFAPAHAGQQRPVRHGDIVTTADGEHYAAEAYPEATTDRELVQHRSAASR